jgi:hypothetical protein
MTKTLLKYERFLRPSVALLWEPRDLWVGVYWDKDASASFYDPSCTILEREYRVYVCLIPCLPIRVTWLRRATDSCGSRFRACDRVVDSSGRLVGMVRRLGPGRWLWKSGPAWKAVPLHRAIEEMTDVRREGGDDSR